MNEVYRHIPGSVHVSNSSIKEEFNTVNELLSIEWVEKFSKRSNFLRYSISGNLLMAEYAASDSGKRKSWWVVGSILKPVNELPEFRPNIYEFIEVKG